MVVDSNRMRGFLLYLLAMVMTGLPFAVQAAPDTILVIGDSLSAAYGIEPQQGWVSLLQRRLEQRGCEHQVVNASISGDTTQGGLTRLPRALEQYHSDIVIIELGANDGLRGLPPAVMQENLIRMVEISRAQGAEVLLLGVRLPVNYGSAFNERFRAAYAAVAEKTGAPLLPRFLSGVAENRELMQADGVHPRAKAQPMILDNVWRVLEPLLGSCKAA